MLYPKPIFLVLTALFGLQVLAEPASPGAQPKPARIGPTALNATLEDGERIGNEQRQRVFMNVGGRRLLLVVPLGFRTGNTTPEKVVLVNGDYQRLLSFRIAAPGNVAAASLTPGLCRGWLSARLGDVKIQEESSLTAANLKGPAFEACYKTDGLSRCAQVAFIPSPVGVLEFSLETNPEVFQAAKSEFRSFLRAFRISDAAGKLEIVEGPTGS